MNRDWAGDSNRTAAVEDAAGALNLAKPLVSSARRPIRGRQADSIAGLSDVKAAEGCRSPKRWRAVLRVELGEAFGLRQSSAAVASGSVAAPAAVAAGAFFQIGGDRETAQFNRLGNMFLDGTLDRMQFLLRVEESARHGIAQQRLAVFFKV